MDNFALIFSLNLVAEHNVCQVLMLWTKNYIPNFGQVQSYIQKVHNSQQFQEVKGETGYLHLYSDCTRQEMWFSVPGKVKRFLSSLQHMKSIVQWILRLGLWR